VPAALERRLRRSGRRAGKTGRSLDRYVYGSRVMKAAMKKKRVKRKMGRRI